MIACPPLTAPSLCSENGTSRWWFTLATWWPRLLEWTGPLRVIYGNNDGEREGLKRILPQIQDGPLWIEAGGKRILVHHYADWCSPADVAQADIIITGHTHEVVNERQGGKLLLNAGECCGWLTGRCTVAILDTDALSAEIIEVES
jgi:putative phosphoesterase